MDKDDRWDEFRACDDDPAADTWAARFTCPNCGRCSKAMVTTKKTCLRCGTGLIRP